MGKNKAIKICLIVVLSIVFFTCMEIVIRGAYSKINNAVTDKKEEKKREEIYNSEEEVTKRSVNTFVENVLKAIEEKDYDYVLHYLNETYYECFFDSNAEKLKSFLEDYLMADSSYQIIDTEKSNYNYFVRVTFSGKSGFHTKDITIQKLQNGNYKIMFGHYDNISTSNYVGKSNELTWTNTYSYFTEKARVFPVEIYNGSGEDINIDFEDIYAIGISGYKKRCNTIDSVTVKAKEKIQVDLTLIDYTEEIVMFDATFKTNDISENIRLD